VRIKVLLALTGEKVHHHPVYRRPFKSEKEV
jgi:hypothetical protein